MKNYLAFLTLLLVFNSCQGGYKIGSSVISIEPTGETISLSLAGFAVPYEGRFTLGWEEIGSTGDISNFTALGDQFYGINPKGDIVIFSREPAGEIKIEESAHSLKFLAGHNNLLYSLTGNGELHVATPAGEKIEWNKLSSGIKDVTSFTSSGENLYVTTSEGNLLKGTIGEKDVSWNKVAEVGLIQSLASDGKRLYALGQDTVLYQCEIGYPQESWTRVGYKNGETYFIDIKQISYSNGKLYANTYDNKLYTNKHNSEGNLSARALSFKKGKQAVVIVGVDVCGFDWSFTQSVKDEIYQKTGIPHEAVLINASHSHFTPVTQSWITWEKQNQHPDTLYLNNVVRPGIIRAVEEALQSAVNGDLYFGRGTTAIGRNRSLRGENVVYDDKVDVLQAISRKENKESILFLTGCHPVVADTEINRFIASANFPGYAREIIEELPNVNHSLFLQGCTGDINPNASSFRETGKQLAEEVSNALQAGMAPINGEISFHLDTISIPVTPWSKEELRDFLHEAEKKPEDGIARRDVRWAKLMLDQYEKRGSPATDMPVYVQTFNIGDWKLVALSREVTTEFAIAIRDLWPDQNVSVAAYTNDIPSYLATDPHIVARDYEGHGSFFWYGQPNNYPLGTYDTVVSRIKENNR